MNADIAARMTVEARTPGILGQVRAGRSRGGAAPDR
jgi:hypothetical protein